MDNIILLKVEFGAPNITPSIVKYNVKVKVSFTLFTSAQHDWLLKTSEIQTFISISLRIGTVVLSRIIN